MSLQRDIELIEWLRSFPKKQSWLEFKANQGDPQRIGKLIAALANAARWEDKETAFLVWGIEDETHNVIGTTFDPFTKKVGNQEFKLWLRNKLSPAPALRFRSVAHPDGRIQLLEIPAAIAAPTAFEGVSYIRVGSATVRLTDDDLRYQALIQKLRPYAWEKGFAANHVAGDDVLCLLDFETYFSLMRQPVPTDRHSVLSLLEADNLIQPDIGERWNILNVGALLFAKELGQFSESLARKGVRFVRYDGINKAHFANRMQAELTVAPGWDDGLAFRSRPPSRCCCRSFPRCFIVAPRTSSRSRFKRHCRLPPVQMMLRNSRAYDSRNEP